MQSVYNTSKGAQANITRCAAIEYGADALAESWMRLELAPLAVSPADLRQKFDFYCDKLSKDFEFGKVEAIGTIAKLKSKPDQARGVISIGIIIGGADGNFDANERRVVTEACNALGVPPAEYDL